MLLNTLICCSSTLLPLTPMIPIIITIPFHMFYTPTSRKRETPPALPVTPYLQNQLAEMTPSYLTLTDPHLPAAHSTAASASSSRATPSSSLRPLQTCRLARLGRTTAGGGASPRPSTRTCCRPSAQPSSSARLVRSSSAATAKSAFAQAGTAVVTLGCCRDSESGSEDDSDSYREESEDSEEGEREEEGAAVETATGRAHPLRAETVVFA